MVAAVEQKKVVQGGAFLIEQTTPGEIFTPEDFTEEHRMIAETTRQFMDNEVLPRIDELEHHNWELARDLVKKAADLGLIGANIPEMSEEKADAMGYRPLGFIRDNTGRRKWYWLAANHLLRH